MSYENAPATKLLATFCACCSRPLLDAKSVETGMGPVCRKKHGFSEAQSPADWTRVRELIALAKPEYKWLPETEDGKLAHALANFFVHDVAVRQNGPDVLLLVNAIAALGYTKLSASIGARLAKVQITADADGYLVVKAPYDPEAARILAAVPGRVWDKEAKVNRFPVTRKADVFRALQRCYLGLVASGPKGLFEIA